MIRDYVDTSLTPHELGDLLTMAGFELEDLHVTEGEPVLDIKVMANRGDGLSALGIAREILAKDANSTPTELYKAAARRFPNADEQHEPTYAQDGKFSVRVETEDSPRIAFRFFEDVYNGDSPVWLQKRLHAAGVRSISLLVDLTNYVMLDVGQPLHAFDFEKIKGGKMIVRNAKAGETLTTLNDQEHHFLGGELIIEDDERIIDLCGIMGGLNTEVDSNTRILLLQGAHFNNNSVRKTRKKLNIASEASYRFERYVDPEIVVGALNRYAALYCAIRENRDDAWLATTFEPGTFNAMQGVLDVRSKVPESAAIQVRSARVEHLLGMQVSAAEQVRHLTALGFSCQTTNGSMSVIPPSWRPDILREEDVAEEVGRVHGYDRIPESAPRVSTLRGGVFGLPRIKDIVRETMLRCGYTQVMSHTLLDRHPLEFSKRKAAVRTPHSPELAFLRDSLLPGLASAAKRNGARDLHLFEIGNVFVQGEIQIDESPELAILSCGALDQPHWRADQKAEADFFSVKGVLEAVAQAIGIDVHVDLPRIPDPRFHPTRQAGLLVDEGVLWVGYFGQIHPDIAEELGLPEVTILAEMDLLVLASEHEENRHYGAISRNPSVRRDIAILISKDVPFQKIEQAVVAACGNLLEKHWLFDVYEGKGVPEGHHSLAIALQFRMHGENMTDEGANEVRDKAIQAVEALGGKIR